MTFLPTVHVLHNFSERKFLLCVSQQILEVAVCALGISNTFKIIQLKKLLSIDGRVQYQGLMAWIQMHEFPHRVLARTFISEPISL